MGAEVKYRRHVYAAFRRSARVLDIAAIAALTGSHARAVAALAVTWAHNDVACQECHGTAERRGEEGAEECADCDGTGREYDRDARVLLDEAGQMACGFCGEAVEAEDEGCARCGVEFYAADKAEEVVA